MCKLIKYLLRAESLANCLMSPGELLVSQTFNVHAGQLTSVSGCFQVPERMQSVLQAAVDLSTSTKPFDSVTAAHLLNLLLHQPNLSQALAHLAQEQGAHLLLSCPPAQASEALVLELNTLAGTIPRCGPQEQSEDVAVCSSFIYTVLPSSVVQFLLHCLQSEVSKAELSLLQAAASFPLYGRAHCITAVLEPLNTE